MNADAIEAYNENEFTWMFKMFSGHKPSMFLRSKIDSCQWPNTTINSISAPTKVPFNEAFKECDFSLKRCNSDSPK